MGQTAGSLFLLIFGLIIAVVALAFVSYQLHSFKGGAVMTRIALLLLLVSNLGKLTLVNATAISRQISVRSGDSVVFRIIERLI